MCGIAGRFNFDQLQLVDRDVLAAMTDVVAHRGPDQAGYHVAPGIGLGHRRLSIIDLSTGDQPLSQRRHEPSGPSSTARSTTLPRSARS